MFWFWRACLVLISFIWPAYASPSAPAEALGTDADAAQKEDKKSKAEKEAEMTEAEQEAERKRKEKLARVVVLKWPGTSVDYTDETVQRNVRSRIARPDAQFFPDVDLYQNGRKVRDRSVAPAMQPAIVPNENIQAVRNAIDEIASVPWNAIQPDAWGLKAQELEEKVELLWFVDRVELREPLFLLYTQIGRAAENQNQIVPPFYTQVGTISVNYYFYLAATLAHQDPGLMSKLTDPDLNGLVGAYLDQLKRGAFPTLEVDFQLETDTFDLETFSKEYEVLFNGMPAEIDEQGKVAIFLGRTDIYMKRKDSGHGLSERLEILKLEDKKYFVRENARKKMSYDFIEQLFLHPNECKPELDGDILNYLAIYAKIHPLAEIYIAVAREGNPNQIWIWRYDRPTATLSLVGGGNDGFPVRFAILLGAGIMYNKATIEYADDPNDLVDPSDNVDTFIPDLNDVVGDELSPAYIPLNIELRGHYNRLMVAFGSEFGFNTGGDDGDGTLSTWIETYRTPGAENAVVIRNEGTVETFDTEDSDGDGITDEVTDSNYVGSEIYHDLSINRNLYMGLGVVFGRDAGIGFGPRLAMRVGWTNVPYALQTTGHFGWTLDAPYIGNVGDRVRPFLDIDARLGGSWPFKNSLAHTKPIVVQPVFGLVLGIGTTF